MTDTYPMAYKEVLTILKYYLVKEDFDKIPKEKIEFFENNIDKEYVYEIDKTKSFSEQNISKKANSIIVSLYREYFVTEEEKKILDQILLLNELNLKKIKAYEEEISNKVKLNGIKSEEKESKIEETALVKVEKDSFWMKIIRKISKFIKK